jgi:protein-arginine kinase activator protein McsA
MFEEFDNVFDYTAPFKVVKPILVKQCPICGFKLENFRETGFVGCSKCYDYFREELAPYIKEIAGAK